MCLDYHKAGPCTFIGDMVITLWPTKLWYVIYEMWFKALSLCMAYRSVCLIYECVYWWLNRAEVVMARGHQKAQSGTTGGATRPHNTQHNINLPLGEIPSQIEHRYFANTMCHLWQASYLTSPWLPIFTNYSSLRYNMIKRKYVFSTWLGIRKCCL